MYKYRKLPYYKKKEVTMNRTRGKLVLLLTTLVLLLTLAVGDVAPELARGVDMQDEPPGLLIGPVDGGGSGGG